MGRFKKKKRSRPFGHSGGPRKTSQPGAADIRKQRDKINAPPTNPGVQNVPRSLKEFAKLKELAHKSTKNTEIENKSKKSLNENDKTQKNYNASDQIASVSSKFMDNEQSDVASADTVAVDREKSHFVSIKKKKKLKLQKLKMKRKLKEELKRKEIEEDEAEPEIVKDVIKFGEVVHRPPQISTLPRIVSKPGFAYRPGRADDLLVKSILKGNTDVSYKTQLCAKRKHLSLSDQRQLEAEKNKAMSVYRNLKMKRTKIKS